MKTLLITLLLLLAPALVADSKDESLKPLGEAAVGGSPTSPAQTDAGLEEHYRAELESRLAEERESYAASLQSLWIANAAVWACLLGFIAMQAVSARKRATELARLKALRED